MKLLNIFLCTILDYDWNRFKITYGQAFSAVPLDCVYVFGDLPCAVMCHRSHDCQSADITRKDAGLQCCLYGVNKDDAGAYTTQSGDDDRILYKLND